MSRIVFVHLYNDRSGSPKVLSQVINAVFSYGVDVDVLTSSYADGFLNNVPGSKRSIFYKRSENKLITLFYYIFGQIYLFFQCFMYFRQDVVFYINTMMPFGAALAAKLMGKRIIFHVHETSLRPKTLKHFLRFIIQLTANKVIFVSKYLLEKESFFKKQQHVIYNALDFPLDRMLKDRDCNVKFNVLMICSLKKYKGVSEFILVADRLLNEKLIDFTLVLNAEKNEIDDWFESVKIPSNVTIYPRQSDVSKFYKSANVLLNLSHPDEWIETFGLTIIEAMSFGIPVIVPPVGGPAEIITNGKEGFHIVGYDVSSISNIILDLASNKSMYSSLSINALNKSKIFSIELFNQQIIKAIEL